MIKKRFLSMLIIASLLMGFFPPAGEVEAAVDPPYLVPLKMANVQQTKVIPVRGFKTATPKVQWYQLDNGSFRATSSIDEAMTPMEIDNGGEPYPQKGTASKFAIRLDASVYNAQQYEDLAGNPYPPSAVSNWRLAEHGAQFNTVTRGRGYVIENEDYISVNHREITYRVWTGDLPYDERRETGDVRPDGSPKYLVEYQTPIDLWWVGEVHQTKTLNASTFKTSLNVGETSDSVATITTTGWGALGPVDVNHNPATTTWSSDRSAVASVDPATGRITAKGPGTANITVRWKKNDGEVDWDIYRTFTVNVGNVNMEVRPSSKTISVGQQQEFVAWKINADGSGEAPIPDSEVSWSIADPTIATIDANGVATGKLNGVTTVQAVWGGYSDTASLIVSGGGTGGLSGDLDVTPTEIEYRDPWSVTPRDITTDGSCIYYNHSFRYVNDLGVAVETGAISGKTTGRSYTYSTYPTNFKTGDYQVYMKIKGSCGETGWIGPKILTVNPIADNDPPEFEVGWVNDDGEIVTQVLLGTDDMELTVLDGWYEKDGEEVYYESSDPDGDSFSFQGFDIAGSTSEFIQNLPNNSTAREHIFGWYNVTMDTVGTHTVKGMMCDVHGACSEATATIRVVPPNPVPRIDGPTEVKEGRPLPEPFSSARSYSPVRGRTIDHSRDEWTNKKDKYFTPGTEEITLHVYDNTGLKSLNPDRHTLTVLPDQPPLAQVDAPQTAIRNTSYVVKNTSQSIDGDVIVDTSLSYQYDKDNDGNYDEEPAVSATLSNNQYTFVPAKVGKYRFKIYAKEDWGKEATGYHTIDVVNEEPFVTFSILGDASPPPTFGETYTITTDQLLSSSWTSTTGTKMFAKHPTDGSLSTVSGRNVVWKGPSGANLTFKTVTDEEMEASMDTVPLYDDYTMKRDRDVDYYEWHIYKGDVLVRTYERINPEYIDYRSRTIYYKHRYSPAEERVASFESFVNGIIDYKGYGSNSDNHYRIIDYSSVYYFNFDMRQIVTLGTMPERGRSNGDGYRIFSFDTGWKPYGASGKFYLDPTQYTKLSGVNLPSGVISAYDTSYWHYWGADELIGQDHHGNIYYLGYDDYVDPPIRGDDEDTRHENTRLVKLNGSTGALMSEVDDDVKDYISGGGYDARYAGFASSAKHDRYAYILHDKPAGEYSGDVVSLVIRNENDDALVKTFDLNVANGLNATTHWTIVAAYGDYIYLGPFSENSNDYSKRWALYAYRWSDGTLAFTVANAWSLSDYNVLAGDGFYYFIDASKIVKQLDLATGTVKNIANVSSYAGTETSVYLYKGDKDGQLYVRKFGTSQDLYYITGDIQYRPESPYYGQLTTTIPDQDSFIASVSIRKTLDTKPGEQAASAGLSFRYVDGKNMYRVEYAKDSISLVKYVNGVRTVLGTKAMPVKKGQYVTIMVKATLNVLKVYVDGSPVISLTDSSFSSGKIGLYSDLSHVSFKNFTITEVNAIGAQSTNAAIVGESITYDKSISDPENDPIATESWKYVQTSQKFLDAGDGKSGASAHHNKTYTTPLATLDKVGQYSVTFTATDDPNSAYPHPSNVFGPYRKTSNSYTATVIIHRKPVASYTVALNGSGEVVWTDSSYDPDRWLSSTNYSTEATGINYRTTRGILQRAYYFIDPNGDVHEGQLIKPPMPGKYTVGMAVGDEYGAWSDYVEAEVTATAGFPNAIPVATMLSPNGTKTNPTLLTDRTPAFQWSQTDADPGTVFKKFQFQVMNEDETVFVLNEGEKAQNTSATTNSWSPATALPTAEPMTVRVKTHDGTAWSEWSGNTWFVINNTPSVTVTYPTSSSASSPTMLATKRPTLTFTANDPDPDYRFKRYEIQVLNQANTVVASSGAVVVDTTSTTFSWVPPSDLPSGLLKVRARVSDGDPTKAWTPWSPWSEYRYMISNRPPLADFRWAPTLIYEGDDVTLDNLSSDPDGDALTYTWTIERPDGTTTTVTTENASIADAVRGTYTIRLRATDASGASDEIAKTIAVQELGISGQISHTAEWEAYRQTWNLKFPDDRRESADFWAGEALVLRASVTDTSTSSTKPERVTAELVATGDAVALESDDEIAFEGTMVETDHAKGLDDGNYTMRFTVHWSNGHIDIDDVPFRIVGNIYDVIVNHQRL